MTQDIQDAIRILANAIDTRLKEHQSGKDLEYWPQETLMHAIRHLAYPDRDTYPKIRRATKGVLIVRK